MASKKKTKGRPTLYKPEYCDELIAHMRGGKSYDTFATVAGVSLSTLYNWEQAHPDFLEAKEKGWMLSLAWWEQVAMAAVTGQVLKNKTGETVVNGPKVNTAVLIFTLKCRFPKQYREASPIDNTDTGLVMLGYERKREKPKKTA